MTIISAVAGPFGTFNLLSFPQRFLFWGLITALIAGGAVGARCVSRRLQARYTRWQSNIITSFVVAVLCVVLVQWVATLTDTALMVHFPEFLILVGLVFLLYLVIFWLQGHLVTRIADETPLMRRVPDELKSPLLRISVSDHFVEIYTERGMHRVRMRFSDAIEQAEGVDGLPVHRSHWVAKQAILSAYRRQGKVKLRLVDGSEVPVSRTYLPNVEAGGWL